MKLTTDWGTWGTIILLLINDYNSFKRCGLKLVQGMSVDEYLKKYVSAEGWLFWQQLRPHERAVLRRLGIAWS